MSDKLYRVKPLAWEKVNQWHGSHADECYVAETAFGAVCIVCTWLNNSPPPRWLVDCDDDSASIHRKEYKTLELAQAAAEAWYRERIGAALEEQP